MMLTLKIIGLAFETHKSNTLKKSNDSNNKNEEKMCENDRYNFNLTFADIFYYIFNYCGVLTGKIPISFRLKYIPLF